MSSSDAAPLTAALLARKGTAAPAALGAGASRPAAAPGQTDGIVRDGERARVTLRLDEQRHLRLKLTAAHLQQSLQELMTEALDRYLDQVGPQMLSSNCTCLAARGRRTAPATGD